MKQNNRELGSRYEDLAAAFLEQNAMKVIEKNFRCRTGEIDLIARDGGYLVFVEVKYRKDAAAGYALEAIDPKKIRTIRRTASFYLHSRNYPETTPCRFDAVGIDGGRITHIKNAF